MTGLTAERLIHSNFMVPVTFRRDTSFVSSLSTLTDDIHATVTA